MYLIHDTNVKALKSILNDGYLKSYSLLEKKPTDHEGSGLYTENKFVYFSCTDKLFDKDTHANVILYFNSKLLFNKSFYVSTHHSSSPNELDEWWVTNDQGKKTKMYKRKYNKYYTKYNTILNKLYKYSISVLDGRAFQIFQQIAVRNKINLNELVAIEFKHPFLVNNSIIEYITKYYPNIIIQI
jgi:hypothetical protein